MKLSPKTTLLAVAIPVFVYGAVVATKAVFNRYFNTTESKNNVTNNVTNNDHNSYNNHVNDKNNVNYNNGNNNDDITGNNGHGDNVIDNSNNDDDNSNNKNNNYSTMDEIMAAQPVPAQPLSSTHKSILVHDFSLPSPSSILSASSSSSSSYYRQGGCTLPCCIQSSRSLIAVFNLGKSKIWLPFFPYYEMDRSRFDVRYVQPVYDMGNNFNNNNNDEEDLKIYRLHGHNLYKLVDLADLGEVVILFDRRAAHRPVMTFRRSNE